MPLKNFLLYLDENLCNCAPILKILQENQIKYEQHLKHFPSGTPDYEWLPYVGQHGWALLTRDQSIRWQSIEDNQVVRFKVREFVVKGGNLRKEEMARILGIAISGMQEAFYKYPPPFIASITKTGAVNLLYDRNGPLHRRFPPK